MATGVLVVRGDEGGGHSGLLLGLGQLLVLFTKAALKVKDIDGMTLIYTSILGLHSREEVVVEGGQEVFLHDVGLEVDAQLVSGVGHKLVESPDTRVRVDVGLEANLDEELQGVKRLGLVVQAPGYFQKGSLAIVGKLPVRRVQPSSGIGPGLD